MLTPLLLSIALAETPVEVAGTLVTTLNEPPLVVLPLPDGEVAILTADHFVQTWANTTTGWELRSQRSEPYAATLRLVDGELWIDRYVVNAEPYAHPAGQTPSPTTGGQAMVSAIQVGTVLSVEPGAALIDRGRKDGVLIGSEVRFMRNEQVSEPAGSGTTARATHVGSGLVTAIEDDKAVVTLARGSEVRPSDLAECHPESSARLTGYPLAPPRTPVAELGFIARPMLPVGALGFAMIDEAWLSVSFRRPLYAELRLAPLEFGTSADGDVFTFAGLGMGGYDGRWFSAGVGLGGASVVGDTGKTTRTLAVVQQGRLGARDGLSLTVRNSFLLMPTYATPDCYYYGYYGERDCETPERDGEAFNLGQLAMRAQVPMTGKTDLFADWGVSGSMSSEWVTGGVSTWLRGNGDPGSLGLEVSAGYGWVSKSPRYVNYNRYLRLNGPIISVGIRYRADPWRAGE